MRSAVRIPTEHEDQAALFRWVKLAAGAQPALNLLYAIPNGGHRHKAVAAKLAAEGVKAGVPDLCLPVARGEFHGLYIEMKRTKGGTVSAVQKYWLAVLAAEGYCALRCNGWDDARQALTLYLDGRDPR
jgi:hypothetical protein